jgi:hypothetical protein
MRSKPWSPVCKLGGQVLSQCDCSCLTAAAWTACLCHWEWCHIGTRHSFRYQMNRELECHNINTLNPNWRPNWKLISGLQFIRCHLTVLAGIDCWLTECRRSESHCPLCRRPWQTCFVTRLRDIYPKRHWQAVVRGRSTIWRWNKAINTSRWTNNEWNCLKWRRLPDQQIWRLNPWSQWEL